MKFFRKTIILLVVLIIAGGAYWYFEVKKKKEKEQAEEKEAFLFKPSDNKIAALTLKGEGKPDIVIKRKPAEAVAQKEAGEGEEEEEEWIISSPVETGGDRYTINSVINSLKESKREEVVRENIDKEGVHAYGLDSPHFSLRFSYEGDNTEHGVDFGIESLDKKRIFARVLGDDKIVSVSTGVRKSLDKSLFDLRDKRISPYSGDDIVGITLLSPMESFVLKREDSDWYFMPEKIRASETRIDIYTGNIRWGSFVEVEEEKGTNYAKYGLDKPRLMLNFKLKDNSSFMFVVGDSITENNAQFYYAMRSSDGMIFQVQSDLVHKLIKSKFELKDRHIFDISDKDVSAVTLGKDETIYSFVKHDDEWEFSDTGEKLDRGYRIDNIVRSVTTAEYEEREPVKRRDDGYGATNIENARYFVTFHFNNGKPSLSVKLTEKNEDTGNLCLTHDDGNTVYYTNGYFLSNFPDKREDLLE